MWYILEHLNLQRVYLLFIILLGLYIEVTNVWRICVFLGRQCSKESCTLQVSCSLLSCYFSIHCIFIPSISQLASTYFYCMCAVCLHQYNTIHWKCSGMQVTQILLWQMPCSKKFTIERHTVDDSEVLHIPNLERTHRHHIPESAPWLHAPFNSIHTVHSAKFLLGTVCQYLLKTKYIITHHRTKHGY